MGCDGGTIPTRDELVRTKKRPEQKDPDSERMFKWQHCFLTQENLKKPIASCHLGRLYNKQALIEALLDKSVEKNPNISHIKSLKDIVELNLTPNPSYDESKHSIGDGFNDVSRAPWICPVIGLEMNGRFKFVFDITNGKVLSERAHKMVKNDDNTRILEENLVIINPVDEEADLMETKMEARKARAKAEKKAKKKRQIESNGGDEVNNDDKASTSKKTKPSSSKTNEALSKPSEKDATKKKSLQQDPTKSDVFKSLFSSHKSAQNKPKAHWVTFDPRYN